MLAFLVGLFLVRMLTNGELRRIERSGAQPQQQLALVRKTGSVPSSLGLVLGLLCAGELLLEVPPLRDAWGLAGALVAFSFRLSALAVWLDAIVVHLGRLSGQTTPYGPTMARGLRPAVVRLLPSYLVAGAALQLVDRGLSGIQLTALYVVFVLVTVVAAPLLHRLGEATRETTSDEAALVQRLSERYDLRIDHVRAERDGDNAHVAGIGPSARIFVGERLLAGPDDELAAVLAHEAAHRDSHHVAWRVAVTTASTIAMVAVAALLPVAPAHGGDAVVAILAIACLLPVLRYLVVGMLRVHQEHAADAYAATQVGAVPLGRFLLRHDDGIPLGGRGGMRYRLRTGHPTLAERLAALGVQRVPAAPAPPP